MSEDPTIPERPATIPRRETLARIIGTDALVPAAPDTWLDGVCCARGALFLGVSCSADGCQGGCGQTVGQHIAEKGAPVMHLARAVGNVFERLDGDWQPVDACPWCGRFLFTKDGRLVVDESVRLRGIPPGLVSAFEFLYADGSRHTVKVTDLPGPPPPAPLSEIIPWAPREGGGGQRIPPPAPPLRGRTRDVAMFDDLAHYPGDEPKAVKVRKSLGRLLDEADAITRAEALGVVDISTAARARTALREEAWADLVVGLKAPSTDPSTYRVMLNAPDMVPHVDAMLAKACEAKTLPEALATAAIWEMERIVAYVRAHAGPWESCFRFLFTKVIDAWGGPVPVSSRPPIPRARRLVLLKMADLAAMHSEAIQVQMATEYGGKFSVTAEEVRQLLRMRLSDIIGDAP